MRPKLILSPTWLMLLMMLLAGAVPAAFNPDTKVSLAFDDTPITAILKMLAEQNHLNLVVSADVDQKVSLTLTEVSLGAALDAVLLPNGYSYSTVEDIVIVKTADQKVTGELETAPYQLKYIDVAVAQEAIKPLLTGHGQVVILGPAATAVEGVTTPTGSRLVVLDSPAVQKTVVSLLEKIDRPRRQVSVEVKIIETNLSKDEKLGINWPKSISASINGVQSPGSSSSEGATAGNEAAVTPLENGSWQLGYLSVHQLDLVLDFLAGRNNSKLLSNPRLTTIEDETASIQVETVIPIQTINRFSEGAVIQDVVTFQDERVGISLKVTPRVNDDSTLTLRVNPIVSEIIGYTGSANNQKPITSERSVITNVTVKDNETLVLGGLLKESSIDTEESIFFLGSIPIIGSLFKHSTKETKTTDLMILITPRILD
jgi:type II secretory pathway component GspD/PulD (secretin)